MDKLIDCYRNPQMSSSKDAKAQKPAKAPRTKEEALANAKKSQN